METLSVTAADISCEHCQRTIERELASEPGVLTVSVDVPTKVVTATYDPTRTTRNAIVARLDEEGYPVAT